MKWLFGPLLLARLEPACFEVSGVAATRAEGVPGVGSAHCLGGQVMGPEPPARWQTTWICSEEAKSREAGAEAKGRGWAAGP